MMRATNSAAWFSAGARLAIAGWCCLLTGLARVDYARALGGPENVVVVVNADSWSSTRTAHEYVRLRRVPDANVVRLRGIPDFERIDVESFRQKILLPVLKSIDERGLARQIDAIVYSTDLPTTIDVRGDVGDRKLPQVLTPEASLNGLTYLYPLVLAKDLRYLDLQANLYARRLVGRSTDTPWNDEEKQRYGAALQKMNDVLRQRRERAAKPGGPKPETPKPETPKPESPKPDGSKPEAPNADAPPPDAPRADAERDERERETLRAAAAELSELRRAHPRAHELLYNLACLEALLERIDEALRSLGEAVEQGWFDHRHAAADPDLRVLRERPEFQQLLDKMKNVQPDLQPLQAFRGLYGWSPQGTVVPPNQGPRYLISTVLSCTSGRGLSVSEAAQQLRRSVEADGTRPAGTIYFPHNGDVRSTTREWGFRPAAAALERLGVRAVVEPGVLPQGKNDVAGAVIGTAGFDWPKSGSTILPGAICEHLTSFGGMLGQDAGQTPLVEFLRHGAAGSSGTVTEPYAIQAKFPTPFVQTAYASGYSLGEAFYQSVSGPYQLLVVGDPLCRPWSAPRAATLEGVPAAPVAGETFAMQVKLADAPAGERAPEAADAAAPAGAPLVCDVYLDGRLISVNELAKPVSIDASRLADGRHELVAIVQRETGRAFLARGAASFVVKNGADELRVTAPRDARVLREQSVAIEARLPGASHIEIRHAGRSLGRIDGPEGTIRIDAAELGYGPVRLLPVGRVGERDVLGAPIDLEVVEPAPAPARSPPADRTPVEGLALRVGDRPPQVVATTRPDWAAKADVPAKTPWTLEAWFEVPSDDAYCFQLEGRFDGVRVLVDDRRLDGPRGERVWQVPVALARGWHVVRFSSDGGEAPPAAGIRFGGPGLRWLEGSRFRHLP